jgi:KRAB domain-containing zinc finger protein
MAVTSNEYQQQLLSKEDLKAESYENLAVIVEEVEEEVETFEIVEDFGDSEEEIDGKFNCRKCDKSFTQQLKLIEHMKTHVSRSRMHSCKTCKRKFTTEILLQRHEIIHSDLITQIKEESKSHCIVCSHDGFSDKSSLEDHMREHKEAAEKNSIDCQHCDRSFTKFNNLLRHLRTHEENKTHLCTVCNKTFAMGQELIDHLNRHKGFTPHSCHVCGKSYLQISKLKNHLKTHSNDKVSQWN